MAVVSYLLADRAVSELVGTRLYPERFPAGATMPVVTYQRIFGAEEINHDGPSGLARARLQLDCWSESYGGAVALGKAVTSALRNYPGARIINVMDLPEPKVALRRRMVEVSAWDQEA